MSLRAVCPAETRTKTRPAASGEYGEVPMLCGSISGTGGSGDIIPVIIIMVCSQQAVVKDVIAGARKESAPGMALVGRK